MSDDFDVDAYLGQDHRFHFINGSPYHGAPCHLPDDMMPNPLHDLSEADKLRWQYHMRCRIYDVWTCPVHLLHDDHRTWAFDVQVNNCGWPESSLAEIERMALIVVQSLNQNINDPMWRRANIPTLVPNLIEALR